MAERNATATATAEAKENPAGGFASIGEIVIEVGDNHNRNPVFAPTQTFLRGRFLKSNLHHSVFNEYVENLPDLPGHRILIDPRRRYGLIFDPLSRDEFRAQLQDAQKRLRGQSVSTAGPVNVTYGPDQDYKFERMKDSEIKTWIFYMRRLVDAQSAWVVSGNLPQLEEIKSLPGKTRIEIFNSSAKARKFFEDPDPYDPIARAG